MVDLCTTCLCTVQVGVISGFKLECRQTTCEDCPLVREAHGGLGVDWVLVGPKQWDLTGLVK